MKKNRSKLLSGLLAVSLVAAMALPAAAALTKKNLSVDSGLSVYVDGKLTTPKNAKGNTVEVFAADGTTYLPVRAMSDALGAQVSYDGTSYSVYVDTVPVDGKAAEYLKEFFGVEPMTGAVSAATFNAALAKVFGADAAKMDGESIAAAVKAAVENCGLKELALTYSAEKANAATAGCSKVSADYIPYVACALDSSLVPGTWSFASGLTGEAATQLLMNAVNIAGKGRNYLGNTTDPDIAAKMRSSFATFYDFSKVDDATVKELWKIGETIVDKKATTGFGLKSSDYDARFLSDYSLKYSHDSIDNAVQLVGLLAGNGIDAKVQLEPKVSIYQWDGKLNSGMEYDLQFEFDSKEDRAAFHNLVVPYVTRNLEGNTASQITHPYITPAYNAPSEIDGYKAIYDNVITCGEYSLHPFSLPDRVENVAAIVDKVAADYNAAATGEGAVKISTSVVPLWCNPAFYTYLDNLAKEADAAA